MCHFYDCSPILAISETGQIATYLFRIIFDLMSTVGLLSPDIQLSSSAEIL